jgi:hypothetical protein
LQVSRSGIRVLPTSAQILERTINPKLLATMEIVLFVVLEKLLTFLIRWGFYHALVVAS